MVGGCFSFNIVLLFLYNSILIRVNSLSRTRSADNRLELDQLYCFPCRSRCTCGFSGGMSMLAGIISAFLCWDVPRGKWKRIHELPCVTLPTSLDSIFLCDLYGDTFSDDSATKCTHFTSKNQHPDDFGHHRHNF